MTSRVYQPPLDIGAGGGATAAASNTAWNDALNEPVTEGCVVTIT